MSRLSALTITTLSLLFLGVGLTAGAAVGQQKTLKEQVVGTWTYASITAERKDGSKFDPWVPNGKGLLIFTNNGRFSVQLMRSDRPKLASNDRLVGTPEENKAMAEGVLSYFGTYSVNNADKTVTVHIEASSFPNWEGTDQVRSVTITGDELKYTAPVSSTGGASGAQAIWKRS